MMSNTQGSMTAANNVITKMVRQVDGNCMWKDSSLKIQVFPTRGEEPQQIQQEELPVQVEGRVEPATRHKEGQKDPKEPTSEPDHEYHIETVCMSE